MSPLTGPNRPPHSHEAPKQLVVMLHGYGADGSDLISLAPFLCEAMPHAAFYAPDAPEMCEIGGPGRQWFSLSRFDPHEERRDPEACQAAYDRMIDGVREGAEKVNAYLDALLAEHGLTEDNLALIGFSQGTMMALHVGLRRANPVACVIGYSGPLVGVDLVKDEIVSRPPVMLIHGGGDEIVPADAQAHAVNALLDANVPTYANIVPDVPHTIDPKGFELGGAFLLHHLLGDQFTGPEDDY